MLNKMQSAPKFAPVSELQVGEEKRPSKSQNGKRKRFLRHLCALWKAKMARKNRNTKTENNGYKNSKIEIVLPKYVLRY